MKEEKVLAELERLMRDAPAADVIAFVEKLVEKQPDLYAPLMEKLKEQRKA
jgi:hypothetical protein